MSEESERTFVVEIPERYSEYRGFIIPLLEALASTSRPKPPRAVAKKAGDNADHAGILANEILELLRKQGTDKKNSSPHGLVLLVVELVDQGAKDLAERAIAAAAADPQISRRMRAFFASLPDGERPEPVERWPDKLRELLSKPHFATLGKKAASRIATKNKEGNIDSGKSFYAQLQKQIERKVQSGKIAVSVSALLTTCVVAIFEASDAEAMGFSLGGGTDASLIGRVAHKWPTSALKWIMTALILIIGALAIVLLRSIDRAESPLSTGIPNDTGPDRSSAARGRIDAPRQSPELPILEGIPSEDAGRRIDASLPRDAGTVDDAGNCDSDRELVLEGEYLAWDFHSIHFCGSFGTEFHLRGGASTTTLPNGRFEMQLPNVPIALLEVLPSPKASTCISAAGFYAVPTIAVASRNVICAGVRWSGREFLAGPQPYDPAKAYVLVHVSGPGRTVSISAAHGKTLAMNGESWAAGATGRDVFFPDVDPTQGQTKVIADDAIAPDSIPLVAGTMTEVTIVTGRGVR